jgi:outer membrane protein TolC
MIFVNKKSAIFCVLFLCGYLISIQAQSEVQKMTLEQALEYASENAYQKRSSNYDVISAQKKIWETIASGLPQVDFSARYNHSLDLTKSLLPIEFFPEAN